MNCLIGEGGNFLLKQQRSQVPIDTEEAFVKNAFRAAELSSQLENVAKKPISYGKNNSQIFEENNFNIGKNIRHKKRRFASRVRSIVTW
ncbi:hypothetical protein AVEN_81841-1 [Araneus ventricosus]|uniref:Uncharacterized protein n=1 Tax=Araneus ventricosus TaxID=182803 RepID=A0A4Y2IEZ9_ARAVE|nr:hypothetical protein AVEN_81841-1 [Araneus ventricosus]